eukprot:TRINITY_DN7479_c0_g1_i1.p2 TRINITY_DN7479_c0_g1~~TRINITY_DN7479_c0_g1_i1.p2  ORF type:complete len:113 (-),score=23.64 TRINITY_DN7479_c0_g1_i1:42-380(-)
MMALSRVMTMEAENGIAACEIIRKDLSEENKSGEIKLIFMDINMPEMDGITATEEIRSYYEKRKLPQIPIIAVTACLETVEKGFIEMGFNEVYAKPITKSTINRLLNQYLKQ